MCGHHGTDIKVESIYEGEVKNSAPEGFGRIVFYKAFSDKGAMTNQNFTTKLYIGYMTQS